MRGDSQNKYRGMELAQNNILNEARLCDKRDTINQTSGAVEKQSERFVTGFAAKKIKDLNFCGNWKSREGTSPVRTRAEGAEHLRSAPAPHSARRSQTLRSRIPAAPRWGHGLCPAGPTEAPSIAPRSRLCRASAGWMARDAVGLLYRF